MIAPFAKGFKSRILRLKEKGAGGGGDCGAANGASALGDAVGAGGLELIVRFTSYFVYIASISPVARASDARDKLN